MRPLPSDWTPVALGSDILPGSAAGVVLQGAELVLWRDESGAPHAWEDRCPHRGMKLSFGFVRGDRMACLYHGWEYGSDSRCKYIPAHPDLDVPETICVTRFGVAEANGFLWVASEGTGAAPEETDSPVNAIRSLFVSAPLSVVINELDRGGLPGLGTVSAFQRPGRVLRLEQGGYVLGIGGHAVSDESCALHFVAEECPGGATLAELVPATAALRRQAEEVT